MCVYRLRKIAFFGAVILALVACEVSEFGNTMPIAYASLSNVSGAATADQCPNGGIEIEHGIDSNGNGMLDVEEVANTYILCDGKNAANGVSREELDLEIETLAW